MNIDAVQQRTGDAFLVSGNDSRCTRTGFLWVRKKPHGQGYSQLDKFFSRLMRGEKLIKKAYLKFNHS
jgi:hypothetical protein